MSKLPVKPDDAVNARIAKLRAATGRPERLDRHIRCSGTGREFTVHFERTDPGQPFKIASIFQDQPDPTGAGPTEAGAKDKKYPGSMIDLKGLACPYCAATGTVYHGTCDITWCSGGIRKVDGRDKFTCPHCAETFGLVETGEVHGMRDAKQQGSALKLLGGAASFLKIGKPR